MSCKEPNAKALLERAIVIAPESLDADVFAALSLTADVELEKTSFVHSQAVAEKSLAVVVSPQADFLLQVTRQIRSHPQTSLIPILAVTERSTSSADGFYQLVDILLNLPVVASEFEHGLLQLTSLQQRTSQFLPPVKGLDQKEQGWLNLLRFLSSREIFTLTPEWSIHAQQGYVYPLVDDILGVQAGEGISQLKLLSQMGLLEGKFYDKIHLCPQCRHFQLNFREVCPECGRGDIWLEENLHHYACSFVAPRREFQRGGSLVCPKCWKLLIQIGVDYDRPSHGYHCPACRRPFNEPLVECHCIFCSYVFSPNNAKLQTVWEYHLSSLGMEAAQRGFVSSDSLKEFLHQQLGLLDCSLFRKMLSIEEKISRRCPRDLCLMKLRLGNYPHHLWQSQAVTKHDRSLHQLWSKLVSNLKDNLREVDLITWLGGEELLILSIGTNIKQADKAVYRIQKRLAKDWPEIKLQSKVVSLPPGQSWDPILQELGG